MTQSSEVIGILGRLEKVDLRTVWRHEALNFTPWLAQPENLAILGEAIGLRLELQALEQRVGIFRLDLVCNDIDSDNSVLIENQFGRTDHDHLGKLLTYAAGLKAGAIAIVWIAETFNDEHRAALDWLNDKTDEPTRFFGIELELWRIGNSLPAPKFNLVSKPNDWVKGYRAAQRGVLSELTQLQQEYWTDFANYIKQNSKILNPTKALAQNWYQLAVGTSDAYLVGSMHSRNRRLSAQVTFAREISSFLKTHKEEVERQIGAQLEWPEDKNYAFLSHDADLFNREDWTLQHKWLCESLEKLHQVFSPRLKALKRTVGIADAAGPDGEQMATV